MGDDRMVNAQDRPIISLHDAKEDNRPMRGWWSPGDYICVCQRCKDPFIGDKRAQCCADCAYSDAKTYP